MVPVLIPDATPVLVAELLSVGEDEFDTTVLLRVSVPLFKLVTVAVME